jgi:hypothetical protein
MGHRPSNPLGSVLHPNQAIIPASGWIVNSVFEHVI